MRPTAFALICALGVGRFIAAVIRVRIYRRHAAMFLRQDLPHIAEHWRGILRREVQALGGLAMFVLIAGLAAAIMAFHPRLQSTQAEAPLGALLFWLVGRFCVEVHYLYNRILGLRLQENAKRTAAQFPRSGLITEALLACYVCLATAAAWGCVRTPLLLGGALSTGAFLLTRVARIFTTGRQLARAVERRAEGKAGGE